jgi:hypothetical protein
MHAGLVDLESDGEERDTETPYMVAQKQEAMQLGQTPSPIKGNA